MPILPYLNASKTKADMQDKFLGYFNHPSADPGQFSDMRNLSADSYPILRPRKPRRTVRTFGEGRALLGGSALSWIADGQLWVDGDPVCAVSAGDIQLVRMGAYIIVWPDRIIYNTHTGELTDMDATVSADLVSLRPCTLSGLDLPYTASDTAPEGMAEESYWYNTETGGLYQLLGGEWQGIDTVYTRIEHPDLGDKYHDYDVVSLKGFSMDQLNMDAATVYAAGTGYIVVATGIMLDYLEEQTVTVSRKAPDMDYICECGNRLWGCSSAKHEIYGSKLGDPTNWNSYLGISTDSYAATVGSAGDFTGIIQYMGYVHFFKEGCIHRLYGTRPENYQLTELPVKGVKRGCWRSLAIVDQILYYVSNDGVLAFDGASPVNVGEALGDVPLKGCVAGGHNHKYYLSSEALLYVMDARKGLWHIEDGLRAAGFASTPDADYLMTPTGELMTIDAAKSPYDTATASDEGAISWWGVTGDIGMDNPNQKWIRKIALRVSMASGASMAVDIEYNSSGVWERALSAQTERKKSLVLPIRTRRCDHFRLRYAGTGDVLIYSMAKTYEQGSERMSYTGRA